MLTILFIILKIANVWLLSWWWILIALIADFTIKESANNSYLNGYEQGMQDKEEEINSIND